MNGCTSACGWCGGCDTGCDVCGKYHAPPSCDEIDDQDEQEEELSE